MSIHSRHRTSLVAAGLALFASSVVGAYVLKGVKWPTSSVPYYVNAANLDLGSSEAEAAVRAGADTWAVQSSARVALVYAGPTAGTTVQNNAKNEVFFRNASNGSAIATTYSYYSGDRIVDTDIVFWDEAFRFFAGTSGCSGGMYIEDIAAHEFGHALGLGHSTVGSATMYASVGYCSQAFRSLDADDIAGIEAIYPASTTAPPAAPGTPAVAVSGASPTSALVVSWADQSTNEDRFRVERSTDGAYWALAGNASANAVTFTDSGLASATTYSYRVRAENTGGESAYAGPASGTTQAPAPLPPAAPGSPLPANGASNIDVNADLAWGAVSNATGYDVHFGTSSSPAPYASDLTSPSLALPALSAGVKYYWKVVAKNDYGSTSGPVWSFTTKAVRTTGKPKK
jgi:hypothetical protein